MSEEDSDGYNVRALSKGDFAYDTISKEFVWIDKLILDTTGLFWYVETNTVDGEFFGVAPMHDLIMASRC